MLSHTLFDLLIYLFFVLNNARNIYKQKYCVAVTYSVNSSSNIHNYNLYFFKYLIKIFIKRFIDKYFYYNL